MISPPQFIDEELAPNRMDTMACLRNAMFCGEPMPPVTWDCCYERKDRMIESTIRPLADNLIIEPIAETLPAGLVLPDIAKQPPTRGRVVAVGEHRTTDAGAKVPMTVQVGDVVVFRKHGTEPLYGWDEEYRIAREADILAVVEP